MSATALPPADTTPSRLPRWTNNALVVAIGVALALLALALLPRPAPPLPRAAAYTGGTAARAPDALELGREIAETHLFGDATVVREAAPPPPAPEKIEDTKLNLQLSGVFAADPQSQAIAIISAGNAEQNAYGVGDKISGETTLKAVYRDHVIITNRGRDEKLSLPDDVAPVAMTPVPQTASVARNTNDGGRGSSEDFSQPVELPSNPGELRDTLARNPSMLGRVVAAEPYQENGKLVGYRITPKQNPEILEAQGIVAGDVITRVNNIQLNSQKQGIRALRNAVKAQNLEVVVLRDGIEVPINISLAQ